MNLPRSIFLLLVVWLVMVSVAPAEPLTISYFERPPYYCTDEAGQPGGLLLGRTKEILREANIEATFVAMTPYRIMYVLQHAKVAHCSVGWFKSPERERFSKFSLPMYRNRALVLLTSRGQQKKFASLHSLHDVFSAPHLMMARMAEFSYGNYVDDMLAKSAPESLFLTGAQVDLLQAVIREDASYMLVAPEEVEMMAVSAAIPIEELVMIKLSDIPTGNLRYLMCSQTVKDETIEQLNRAISSLYRKWGAKNCE